MLRGAEIDADLLGFVKRWSDYTGSKRLGPRLARAHYPDSVLVRAARPCASDVVQNAIRKFNSRLWRDTSASSQSDLLSWFEGF